MVLEFHGYNRGAVPATGTASAAVICQFGSERLTLAYRRHEAEARAERPDYVAQADDLWRLLPRDLH